MPSRIARGLLVVAWITTSTLAFGSAEPPSRAKARGGPGTKPGKPSDPRQDAWVELTPLDFAGPARAASLPAWDELSAAALPSGRWMVCAGGPRAGVVCERQLLGDRKPVRPELSPGVAVLGRILVGTAPSAEAEIRLLPEGLAARRPFSIPLRRSGKDGRLVRNVTTDRRGAFRLPPLAAGDYVLEVLPPGGRLYRSEAFRVPRPEEIWRSGSTRREAPPSFDLGELRFDAGAELEVFVTGSDGAPVAGAEVGGHQGGGDEGMVLFETRADGDGRAVLRGIDTSKAFHLACLAPGYARKGEDFEVPPSVAECRLEALCGIRGRVVDTGGDAVVGGTVASEDGRLSTRTDKAGTFELSGVLAGAYHLEISAPDYRTGTADVELSPGDRLELPETTLLPGEDLVGRVLEEGDRKPIAGAQVTVLSPRGGGSAVSDADGEFRLTTDLDGPVTLRAEAQGYPPRRYRFSPGKLRDGGPVDLALGPGGRIRVIAWDDEADAPCVGCFVTIQSPEAGGRLQTDGTGVALSEPLAPGAYPVGLVHEEAGGSAVRVSGGDNIRIARVEAGKTSTVVFGEPSRALTVRLRPPPPAGWNLVTKDGGRIRSFTRSPGDGDFHLRWHPGEAVSIRLSGGGMTDVALVTLPADFSGGRLDLELPSTEVRGRLLRGVTAAGGQEVHVVSIASGSERAFTVTDGEGRFSLPYLAQDTYSLVVEGRVLRSFGVTPGRSEDLGAIDLPSTGPGGG